MSSRVQKVMTQPINLIFRFLQNKSRIQIWLYENTNTRIEGRIIVRKRFRATFRASVFRRKKKVKLSTTSYPPKHTSPSTVLNYIQLIIYLKYFYLQGFDEYMNLTLDDAVELDIKKQSRKKLGRILLKGDNITLMMNTTVNDESE